MLKRSLLMTLFALAYSNCASAQDMTLKLGGFYSQSDSSMDVTNPSLGKNYTLDFESDLALAEDQFLPFFEVNYQFNDRHHIYLDWKQLHRNSEIDGVVKPFQIEMDDVIYDIKAGGRLETTLNIDIARVGYGYDVFQGTDYSLGLSLGLHAMFIDTGFEGVIGACASAELVNNVCGSTPIPRVVDESVTAPLPDIGVYAEYELLPGWQFTAHGQYFYVKLDDLKGSLVDVQIGVDANITANWHMSVAYNYYKVDVDIAQTAGSSDVNIADYNIYYSFVGPMLAISYTF